MPVRAGHYKGLPQDTNVFAWVYEYELNGQPVQNKSGSVVLIR